MSDTAHNRAVVAAWLALAMFGAWPARGDEPPPAPAAPATEQQINEWRSRIKSTLFVPDPLPALEPEFHGAFRPAPGVRAERVSYGTQFGQRIPAIVYLPEACDGKVPALIVVNGHGGDKFTWYSSYSGILYARAGAAVLTFDPIGEGERNAERRSGTRAHDRKVEPEEMARRMGGLLITDVMQAVSYLAQRPEVEAGRIGAMGYSLGSFLLGITGAVEPRLRACVLVGGGNLDGPDGYWDRSNKAMCQSTPYRSLMFLGDRPAALYAMHASRGPTLVYNGLADTVVSIPDHAEAFFADLRQRAERLRGSSAKLFDVGFLPDASHRPFFVTRPVALWLDRQLDLPAWSPADIEAMPETHIGPWAEARGVAIDRLYATEEREGGTRALGADVPAIDRNALFVFSPEEWERRKDRLIYESWVDRAKAAMAADPHPAP
jgi:dienelactone hydrolase